MPVLTNHGEGAFRVPAISSGDIGQHLPLTNAPANGVRDLMHV